MAEFYTLAKIARANRAGGFHFFDAKTLRFFGDGPHTFKVRHRGGRVALERMTPALGFNGEPDRSTVGRLYAFNPRTGNVLAMSPADAAEFKAAPEDRKPTLAQRRAAHLKEFGTDEA